MIFLEVVFSHQQPVIPTKLLLIPMEEYLLAKSQQLEKFRDVSTFKLEGLNEDGTIYDPEGPANFEDAIFNLCFTTENAGTCAADFDVNGIVDVNDLLVMLSDFGCTASCVADLDGDDIVGATDILVFLVAFGALCAE